MTPKELEEKFKAAEESAATGAKGLFAWGDTHRNAVRVILGLVLGLIVGFVLFHK